VETTQETVLVSVLTGICSVLLRVLPGIVSSPLRVVARQSGAGADDPEEEEDMGAVLIGAAVEIPAPANTRPPVAAAVTASFATRFMIKSSLHSTCWITITWQ
jgi:hypothetical protein